MNLQVFGILTLSCTCGKGTDPTYEHNIRHVPVSEIHRQWRIGATLSPSAPDRGCINFHPRQLSPHVSLCAPPHVTQTPTASPACGRGWASRRPALNLQTHHSTSPYLCMQPRNARWLVVGGWSGPRSHARPFTAASVAPHSPHLYTPARHSVYKPSSTLLGA